MTLPPRPDRFTWTCVGLLVAPTVVIVVAGAALFLTGDEAMSGPAGLGAAFGLLIGLPLLVVEYLAVGRRSCRATALIAYPSLYLAALGSFTWLVSLMDVLRLKKPGPKSMSGGELAIYSAFLVVLVVVGFGHLRWLRLLKPRGQS